MLVLVSALPRQPIALALSDVVKSPDMEMGLLTNVTNVSREGQPCQIPHEIDFSLSNLDTGTFTARILLVKKP